MEKRIAPGATAGKKSKEDEEILELAEEVLSSSDDEIIGLDQDAVVTADEDDDVIDLTDVSEPPLTDEDDILDLTEELEQDDESDEIQIAEDDEIMELEDITDVSADTEVAILELDEAIDALAEPKEEILVASPEATEDAEEDIIDLRDTVEKTASGQPAGAKKAFTLETDTVELSDSDRAALENEFAFETEDEGLPESDAIADEPDDGGFLAGTLDQDLDDTIELTETADKSPDEPPAEPPVEFAEEPMELTDEDRATLEEEIGTEAFDEIDIGLDQPAQASADYDAQQVELMAAQSAEEELGLQPSASAPEETAADQPEQAPMPEAEIRFDAEELSMGDEGDEEPVEFGTGPEEDLADSDPDLLQRTLELADVNGEALQAEVEREAAGGEELEPVAEEILDVGLDDDQPLSVEETASEDTDASLAVEGLGLTEEPSMDMAEPSVSEVEEFTIESSTDLAEDETPLTAEALTAADSESDSEVGISADAPSGTTFDAEEDDSGAVAELQASANGMSVNFDHGESFEQTDLHKDADPISIRVKEPATEDHADEDALLNKVFEPRPEDISPQELEQTVERVVGQMLSEKIEVILADAIEKAVEKEIGRLKKLLLDDLNRFE